MVQPIVIDRWVSEETTAHPWFCPAYFNSCLSMEGVGPGQNAKLTIYLRVWLEKVGCYTPRSEYIDWPRFLNTRTGQWLSGLEEWPDADFYDFRNQVKQRSDSFWGCNNARWGNRGVCLVPTGDWAGLDWPLGCNATHRLNVDCDFRLVLTNGEGDAHITFKCVNVPNWNPSNGPFPAFAKPGTADTTGIGLLALQSVKDPRTNAYFSTTTCSGALLPSGACVVINGQFAVQHEIGHALGLPHSGVSLQDDACIKAAYGSGIQWLANKIGITRPDWNVDECTSKTVNFDVGTNIMGIGSDLVAFNVRPWLLRLARHTHTSPDDWGISLIKRLPTRL
jgi:hypothetical protein